jgi:hypothetical protein
VAVAVQAAQMSLTAAVAAAIAVAPAIAVVPVAVVVAQTFANTCLTLGSFLISMVMEGQQDLITKIQFSLREAKTESGMPSMTW